MQEHLIELCVGETLLVGQYRVTVLQVDGDDLSIEVDDAGDWGTACLEDAECIEDTVPAY